MKLLKLQYLDNQHSKKCTNLHGKLYWITITVYAE